MRHFDLSLELTPEEIVLLKTTDWGEEEHDEEERFTSLIKKGLIRGDYIFETLMTYKLTETGKTVLEQLTEPQIGDEEE